MCKVYVKSDQCNLQNVRISFFEYKITRVSKVLGVNGQMKELNESLRTEKSSRTDLEMYVAVLNTQKTVLQEETDKLRDELQEGLLYGPYI